MLKQKSIDVAVNQEEQKNRKIHFYTETYEWVGIVSFASVIFVLLFTYVFREVYVYGNSMMDTLHNGDRLVICNINYKPQCDDIVVIYAKNIRKPIVKRVIAVGGQTVNIDYAAHRVYVNGALQYEPFIKEPTAFSGVEPIISLPATVPENCVFVMGDNRNDSNDSRSGEIGMVNTKYIIGKVLLCYFPLQDMKILNSN